MTERFADGEFRMVTSTQHRTVKQCCAAQEPIARAGQQQSWQQSGRLARPLCRGHNRATACSQAGPKDPNGCNNLGVLHARAGETALARQDFQKALRLDPTHAEAKANLGRLQPPAVD